MNNKGPGKYLTQEISLRVTAEQLHGTYPSYLSSCASVVKWSLAWLALSVTVGGQTNKQKEKNQLAGLGSDEKGLVGLD